MSKPPPSAWFGARIGRIRTRRTSQTMPCCSTNSRSGPLRRPSATISWSTIRRRFTDSQEWDDFWRVGGRPRLGWMGRLKHLETFPDVDGPCARRACALAGRDSSGAATRRRRVRKIEAHDCLWRASAKEINQSKPASPDSQGAAKGRGRRDRRGQRRMRRRTSSSINRTLAGWFRGRCADPGRRRCSRSAASTVLWAFA
jgi:hypothetical protein